MGGGCQRRGAREECRVRTERRGPVLLGPGCREGERPGDIAAAPRHTRLPRLAATSLAGSKASWFPPVLPYNPGRGDKAIS